VGLEPIQTTDELAMYKWLNDPAVRESVGRPRWKPCYSLEQVQDLIRERLAQPSRFDMIVVDLADVTPRGLVEITHLHPMSNSAEMALIWGEEKDEDRMVEALTLTASYAFDTQSMHRLWTRVPSGNLTLLGAFEKAGFRAEGMLREDHFSGGVWRDAVLLSLLSEEAGSC